MAKSGSIAELRRELAARQAELRKLEAQRKGLAKKLDAVDRQMAALTGGAPKKAKRVAAKRTQRAPRRRGRKTLADYIAKVLAKAKEGMRAKDIVKAVQRSGYPSKTKTFSQMVLATLAKDDRFERVSHGVYRLAQ